MATPSTRVKRSTQQRESRYTQGGTTDRYATRLGWWERNTFEQEDTDIFVTIRAQEEFRPDLLAYRVYGRTGLMWLVLQYNNIIDIQTEFVAGKELRLPTQRRVTLDLLNSPTGGNPV